MKRLVVKLLIISVLFALVVGCATLGTKPWADRSAQEKALIILQTYNGIYQNTMNMALSTGLTEAQKEMVRNKKAILTEVYPLIQIYLATIEAGGVPTIADEQNILSLLDRLGGKL